MTPEEECAIVAKAIQQDIYETELLARVEDHQEMLDDMGAEIARLAIYKNELMAKVAEHLQDHERMEAEQAQLATYKSELMAKARDHILHLQ